MPGDERGVELEQDFNRLELRFVQRPHLVWSYLLVAAFFPVMIVTLMSPDGTNPLFPLFVLGGMLVGIFWTLLRTRPIRLILHPAALEVEVPQWGFGARVQRNRLPLGGLHVEIHPHVSPSSATRLWTLVFTSTDQEGLKIRGLTCSEQDTVRIVEAIEEAQVLATERIGDGEAEVPAALRAIQGAPAQEGP